MENKRIEYFDVAKGILILMVVLGHIMEVGPINQFVYTFHMPAFFAISGIMFHYSRAFSKPLWKTFWDKIYTLVIPFLFFELIGVIANIISYGRTLNVFGYVYQTLILDCNNGPDWFIWVLFRIEVLFILIHRIVKNEKIFGCIIVCIGVILIVFHNYYHLTRSTGVGLLFMVFGYFAKDIFVKKRNCLLACSMGIITVIICAVNGKVDLGPWQFGYIPLYIVGSITGTIFVIEISKFITSKLLMYYGRNTLTVLGTHQAINLTFKARAGIEMYSLPESLLVFAVISLLELPIIWGFNKVVPFLVGKKRKVVASKNEKTI